MARFVFQLEGVLRQRKLVEDQKHRELAVIQAEYAALELQLRAMDQEVQSATADVRTNHLTGQLDLELLAAHRRYTLAMQRRAMGIAQQMAAVQTRLDAGRRAVAEAAKQRKIIEKLREKRHAAWAAELNRKEMVELDEVSTRIGYRNSLELLGRTDDNNGAQAEACDDDNAVPANGSDPR